MTKLTRTYANSNEMTADYFIGTEVEHTKMFGKRTLFVRGFKNYLDVIAQAKQHGVEHIFFGADHSYQPLTQSQQLLWQMMIKHCLDAGYDCSLDIPQTHAYDFVACELQKNTRFHPQIYIKLQNIEHYNANTHIKIDDRNFAATNKGVWTVALDKIVNNDTLTEWNEYLNDEVIE